MATPVTTAIIDDEHSTVCWGAVIAGGLAATAVTLVLLAFGVGIGLSVVSPWSDQGVSATTLHVGSGIYMVVTAMLASTVGGYLAGRLRARWAGVHQDEVYFRDTAHGVLAWALATVVSAAALGGATTHILAGASAGSVPAAAVGAAQTNGSATDLYVDRMLRNEAPPVAGAASPQVMAGNASSTYAELGRLLGGVTGRGGEVSAADRSYAVRVVMQRTGLPQPEAEKRVNDTIAEAKKAADDARRATAKLSLWLAGALLAGALASALAATEGGLLRDSKWWESGWRPGAFGAERAPR
jgi:hypothetical protein